MIYITVPQGFLLKKKKLFESASEVFQANNRKQNSKTYEQRKISKLESKLRDREEAIAILLKENIDIKKNISGEI